MKRLFLLLVLPVVCWALTPDESYYLPPYAKEKVKYAKNLPVGKPWGVALTNAVITVETPLSDEARKLWPREKIAEPLSSYVVVSEHEWCNGFSHGGVDLCGSIKFPSGETYRYFLRPGGLGGVVYPDGGIIYLSGSRSSIVKEK